VSPVISQACWRGRFSQKLSRFPTRNACADAESTRLDASMMGGMIVVVDAETLGRIRALRDEDNPFKKPISEGEKQCP
jgi:hypothetical protein